MIFKKTIAPFSLYIIGFLFFVLSLILLAFMLHKLTSANSPFPLVLIGCLTIYMYSRFNRFMRKKVWLILHDEKILRIKRLFRDDLLVQISTQKLTVLKESNTHYALRFEDQVYDFEFSAYPEDVKFLIQVINSNSN